MSGQREWWANVYDDGLGFCQCQTRERAAAVAGTAFPPLYRIHVRLKPEGAPRRYASEGERRAWDMDPAGARFARQCGKVLIYHGPPAPSIRTPKIEESAR